MAKFLPRLFGALVVLGELERQELLDDVDRANRSKGPQPPGAYLTATIKRKLPGRVSEATAREVLPAVGIPWTNELRCTVTRQTVASPPANPAPPNAEDPQWDVIYACHQAGIRKACEINKALAAAGLDLIYDPDDDNHAPACK